jgi:hypothetical protein
MTPSPGPRGGARQGGRIEGKPLEWISRLARDRPVISDHCINYTWRRATTEALVHLPLMAYEPSSCSTLITYEPLGLWGIHGPCAPQSTTHL